MSTGIGSRSHGLGHYWNSISKERKLELREIARKRCAGIKETDHTEYTRFGEVRVTKAQAIWLCSEAARCSKHKNHALREALQAAMEGRPYDLKPELTKDEKKYLELELRAQKKFAKLAAAKAKEKNARNGG